MIAIYSIITGFLGLLILPEIGITVMPIYCMGFRFLSIVLTLIQLESTYG